MNVREWVFYQKDHPVYERPQADTRWIAPLAGFKPRAYTPPRPPGAPAPYPTAEPLRMDMVGHPSVNLTMSGQGNTVLTMHLRSAYASQIDLTQIKALARDCWMAMKRLSHGPYSLKDLRKMGHPYGFGATTTPSWQRLNNPRAIPSFSIGQRRGARAAVPNGAVINRQSGLLERSWHYSVMPWAEGVNVVFWNTAKSKEGAAYPWFLAHGTVKMQPHGPWASVTEELLPDIQNAWRQGARDASMRQRAIDRQFGEDATDASFANYEAGGFM